MEREMSTVVVLNNPPGGQTYVSPNAEETALSFNFPEGKPSKLSDKDLTMYPQYLVNPAKSASPTAYQEIYNEFLKGAASDLLNGSNKVVISYGGDSTRKFGITLGDSQSKNQGLLTEFTRDLFSCPEVKNVTVSISAWALRPLFNELTDLIEPKNKPTLHFDSKTGNANVSHSEQPVVKNEEEANKTLNTIFGNLQKMWKNEEEQAQQQADLLKLNRIQNARIDDEVDFGPASSTKSQSQETLEPFIPELYHDRIIGITIHITHGKLTEENRKSSQWGTAMFVVLPDSSRPEMVGALRAVDAQRFEQVQKINRSVLTVLAALRLKRRVPFSATPFTAMLRPVYRESGERETEMTMIKKASFRRTGKEDPGSPLPEGPAPGPTTTLMLFHLQGAGGTPSEAYHAFNAARIFCGGGISVQSVVTRSVFMDILQMDYEITNLKFQLDVAKTVHEYPGRFFEKKYNIKKDNGEEMTLAEREEQLLARRKVELEAEREVEEQTKRAEAQKIAEQNIQIERSKVARLQQQEADCRIRNKRLEEQIRDWKNKDLRQYDRDIETEIKLLGEVEQAVLKLETEQEKLKKDLEGKQAERKRLQSALEKKQREQLEAMEKRKAQARQEQADRIRRSNKNMEEMRQSVVGANNVVLEVMREVAAKNPNREAPFPSTVQKSITEGIDKCNKLLSRLLPDDHTINMDRIDRARKLVEQGASHEMLYLQKVLKQNGVPLPTEPSSVFNPVLPLDAAQPVVRLEFVVGVMNGLSSVGVDRSTMRYSVAAVRNGKVLETPRRAPKGMSVEWQSHWKLVTRLPLKGQEGMDLMPMTIIEYLPSGLVSEALPFDIDLHALACKGGKTFTIVPSQSSELSLTISVKTKKARRRGTKVTANPLAPIDSLWKGRHIDAVPGDSSDDDTPYNDPVV